MALWKAHFMPLMQIFVPILSPLVRAPSVTSSLHAPGYLSRRLFSLPVPILTQFNISSILQEIWDSILRAVPKKKTSHSKTRSRQMAGKALKDVTALNKCSACGNVKRAHLLCPYCVQGTWSLTLQLVLMVSIGSITTWLTHKYLQI